MALRDDLAYAAGLLEREPDATTCHYLAGFLGGVARQARDRPLAEAALRAPSKGLRDALQERFALPDQAFARAGLSLGG